MPTSATRVVKPTAVLTFASLLPPVGLGALEPVELPPPLEELPGELPVLLGTVPALTGVAILFVALVQLIPEGVPES